jgi:hypothetical protein
MINGSDNHIHHNTFTLDGYRNAILFQGIIGDGIYDYTWRPSSRNNKIHDNNVIGGREERILHDGIAAANCLYTAYVTNISGNTVTLNLKKVDHQWGTLPSSYAGFDMVVVNGVYPGLNF